VHCFHTTTNKTPGFNNIEKKEIKPQKNISQGKRNTHKHQSPVNSGELIYKQKNYKQTDNLMASLYLSDRNRQQNSKFASLQHNLIQIRKDK
jgi:hypothetical protein